MGATGMLAQQGLQAGTTVANTFAGAYASRQEAKYQRRAYDFNARMAEYQAADAIKRGEKDAQTHERQVKQLLAEQRANYSAQGVDPNYGSAQQITSETAQLGRADAMTIRGNAFREAYGYRAQAEQYRGQRRMAGRLGKLAVRNQYMSGYFDLGRQALGAMPLGGLQSGDPNAAMAGVEGRDYTLFKGML